VDGIRSDSMNTIETIAEDSFHISDLSEEETQLLECYHNRYMSEMIFPHVTKDTPDKDILKQAELLGKKSPSKSR